MRSFNNPSTRGGESAGFPLPIAGQTNRLDTSGRKAIGQLAPSPPRGQAFGLRTTASSSGFIQAMTLHTTPPDPSRWDPAPKRTARQAPVTLGSKNEYSAYTRQTGELSWGPPAPPPAAARLAVVSGPVLEARPPSGFHLNSSTFTSGIPFGTIASDPQRFRSTSVAEMQNTHTSPGSPSPVLDSPHVSAYTRAPLAASAAFRSSPQAASAPALHPKQAALRQLSASPFEFDPHAHKRR